MKQKALAILFVLFLSLTLVACKDGNKTNVTTTDSTDITKPEKEKPLTPVISLDEENRVVWEEVKGSSYYVININGVDNPIKETSNFYKFIEEPGSYSIKVKSVNKIGESEYSNAVTYSVSKIDFVNNDYYSISGESLLVSGKSYSIRYDIPYENLDYENAYILIKDKNENEVERISLSSSNGVVDISSIKESSTISIEGIVEKTFALSYENSDFFTIIGNEKIAYNDNYKFKVLVNECASDSTPIVEVDGNELSKDEEGYYVLTNVKHNPVLNVTGLKKNVYTVQYAKNDSLYTVETMDEIEYGSTLNVKVIIKSEYVGKDTCVISNGVKIGNVNETIEIKNVTENQMISIENINVNKHSINYAQGIGFNLIGVESVYEGSSVDIRVDLNEAYNKSNVIVKANGTILSKNENSYTLNNIRENVNITVEGIEKNKYSLEDDKNTDFTYEYVSLVEHGGSASVTVNTAKKFSRIDLIVNGVTYQSSNGTFVINDVTGDLLVKAVGYTPKEEFFLNSAYNSEVVIDSQKIESTGEIEVSKTIVGNSIAFGFDSLKMKVDSPSGYFTVKSNGNIVRILPSGNVLRVNLDWVKEGFTIYPSSRTGTKETSSIELSLIDVFDGSQSSFIKTNEMIYAAYEENVFVIDSYGITSPVYVYKGGMPFDVTTTGTTSIESSDGKILYMSSDKDLIDNLSTVNRLIISNKENGYDIDFAKFNDENPITIGFNNSNLTNYIALMAKGIDTTMDAEFGDADSYKISYKGVNNSSVGIDLESVRSANIVEILLKGALNSKKVELSFKDKSYENTFYSVAAWGDLNGGKVLLYDDYMIIDASWQLNIVESWLSELSALGHKKIEFDIEVSGNSKYIQVYETGKYLSEEPYAKTTFTMGTLSPVWLRGKTELNTTYGDPATIHSGNFKISNLRFIDEVNLEEEFYESSAWSNINGGKMSFKNDQLTITNSWQLELSETYINALIEAGYKALEFDIKITKAGINAIQLQNGSYLKIYDGVAHLRWVLENGALIFRGKTKAEGSYQENVASFNFILYNATFDKELKEGEESVFKHLFSSLNGGGAVYEPDRVTISSSWQINISRSYAQELMEKGYTKLSFDIELKNPELYLAYKYNGTQYSLEKTANGKYHLEIELSILNDSEFFIRCKTNVSTSFDDAASILGFSLTLSNLVTS